MDYAALSIFFIEKKLLVLAGMFDLIHTGWNIDNEMFPAQLQLSSSEEKNS